MKKGESVIARPERHDADYFPLILDTEKNKRIKISAKDRERIFLRDKGRCIDCGSLCGGGWKVWKPSVRHFELNGTHEIHHIIPVEKGGETTLDNLILLCIFCHRKRHKIIKGRG